MISSLSIDLDETCFTLCDKPTPIAGILRAQCDEDMRAVYSQLHFVGHEHVGSRNEQDEYSVLFKDQHTVDKWTYDAQDNCYVAPFLFHVPGCLPPTVSLLTNKSSSAIEYHISATLPAYGIRATRPVEFFRSCDLLRRQPRIYWGTTNTRRWRYELEVPATIPIDNASALSVRIRSSWKTVNQSKLESCLVACQLLETLETKHHPTGYTESRMTATHVLMTPSQSWNQPCRLPISFPSDARQPHPNVSTELIKIRHTLCVTLAFSSTQGHNDKLQFRIPVDLVHTMEPKVPKHVSRPSSSFYYYTDSSDDCESKDSAVFLSC
ncbi:hypothetical protein BJV82DRAFT_585922 [Fennellomyces sp. T-0311]|nr:hypothetical protein BJV82DRAFT_585922 [Fennellomyces sp. T-0311]